MTVTQSQYLNTLAGQTSFDIIQKAHDNHNYDQVIELSTHIIMHDVQPQESKDVALYFRAQALGMKGQFGKAVQDAQEIIRNTPTQAIGYLRLGQLLSMQGKQLGAIRVYEEALVNVQNDNPAYSEFIQEKQKATEKCEQKLDFTNTLPLEIVGSIFRYLPEKNKGTCLVVSSGWRDKLINSQIAWVTIENKCHCNYSRSCMMEAFRVLRVMPYVAQYVENMTLQGPSLRFLRTYLKYFENGEFKKIKYLEFPDADKLMFIKFFKLFANALWETRNTLTKLELWLHNDRFENTKTKIIDLLFYSPHLRILKLDIQNSLAPFMGNVEFLGRPLLALEDVEIRTNSTTGRALKPLLQYCPNLRRLYLPSYCETCVIDVVDEICNENLQIFVCNNNFSPVSSSSLEKMDREYYDGPPGLREILVFTYQQHSPPPKNLLRLLHKNQKSLQTVYVELCRMGNPNVLGEQYHFERVQRFIYSPGTGEYNLTDPLFSNHVTFSKTAKLQWLSIRNTPNLPVIIESLLSIPPVEKLELGFMEHDDGRNGRRLTALVRLFESYASLPEEGQKLREVAFKYCNFITDQVLLSLAQLVSLKTINFTGSQTIPSTETLKVILGNVGDQLTSIEFVKIFGLDDDVLDALGNLQHLENIKMDVSGPFTEAGLMHLVNHAKVLKSLSVYECVKVSNDNITYLKNKIKYFDYSCAFVFRE